MHQLVITRDIIDISLRAAKEADAREVRCVYLTIGDLRDIVDSLFRSCFEHFTKGTAAENARLDVVRVPFTVTCRACGCTHPADIHSDASFACPQCGKTDYELHTGMEFSIDKIEVA